MLGRVNFAALVAVGAVAIVGNITPIGAECTGGIAGVESTSLDACCVEACGLCGGPGCNPGANSTLTAADCCATEIVDTGVLCSVSGAAPCILSTEAASPDSVCDNGQTGIQDPDTDVCCPLECGTMCGGEGCGTVPGVNASQCCAALIIAENNVCSDTQLPPCVVEAIATVDNSTTCSNGIIGIEDTADGVCCDATCGQCGGPGCGNIPGLSASDCCATTIAATGTLCSVSGTAPCIVDPPDVTPSTCPNGLAGVQDDTVCCAEACNGVCGGVGCGSIAGTNGASDCCSATILGSGIQCTDGVEAPCIMVNGTYTDAPTAAPVVVATNSPIPGATSAPTAGSRGGLVTMAPTTDMEGQTIVPTSAPTLMPVAGSRGGIDFGTGIPTEAPTSVEDTIADSAAPTPSGTTSSGDRGIPVAPSSAPTSSAETTPPPTSGAQSLSTGAVVTLTAMAAGVFAIYAAGRN